MRQHIVTRTRRLPAAAALLSLALLVLGASGPAQGETRLKFVVWNYQVETVQEFVKQFEAENPDVKVDMEVIPSAQYAAKLRLMKNASTPFDALYVFDHILSQWATWLEPLDGYQGADH